MSSASAPRNLRGKPALILGISEGSRGELGGAQIEIGTGELRVSAHGANIRSSAISLAVAVTAHGRIERIS